MLRKIRRQIVFQQDIVTLIYGNYCALSLEQRRSLLVRVKAMLKPGG
jgi:hypothetical protein